MNSDPQYVKNALETIAKRMKQKGANMDQLSKMIDKVLGSGLTLEDRDLIESWEQSRQAR